MSDIVMGALIAARDYLQRAAQSDAMYGHFPGGDPRAFSPDPECSTEAERAAHAAACAAWERGERPTIDGPHRPLPDGEEGHMTVSGFGLGVYQVADEEAADALDQVCAAIRALEGR